MGGGANQPHPGTRADCYGCFLPDLTEFTSARHQGDRPRCHERLGILSRSETLDSMFLVRRTSLTTWAIFARAPKPVLFPTCRCRLHFDRVNQCRSKGMAKASEAIGRLCRVKNDPEPNRTYLLKLGTEH